MVDIHSATAEIRRGKKKRRKKEETTWPKYNVCICYAGRAIRSSVIFHPFAQKPPVDGYAPHLAQL